MTEVYKSPFCSEREGEGKELLQDPSDSHRKILGGSTKLPNQQKNKTLQNQQNNKAGCSHLMVSPACLLTLNNRDPIQCAGAKQPLH